MTAYTRNPQTIPDDTPGGSTVRQGVADQNSIAIDDLFVNLNSHSNNEDGRTHLQIDTSLDYIENNFIPAIEDSVVAAEEAALAAQNAEASAKVYAQNSADCAAYTAEQVGIFEQEIADRFEYFYGRNKIINGDFDVWQRGIVQTNSGYGSDDRWYNINSGSTKQVDRMGLPEIPGGSRFYSRLQVTTAGTVSCFVQKTQQIEGVHTFANQTVTFSFWARADSSKNMSVDFVQYFGTGGSPSPTVESIGPKKFALSTAWQKFIHTFNVPSIDGKTIGADSNDYLKLRFWFDAGSNHNTNSSSLGNQSGTFDLAQVQLEVGQIANVFEKLSNSDILQQCLRFYETGTVYAVTAPSQLTRAFIASGGGFNVRKRSSPTMVYTSVTTPTNNAFSGYSTGTVHNIASQPPVSSSGIFGYVVFSNTQISTTDAVTAKWTADCELV